MPDPEDVREDPAQEADREGPPAIPRWVKLMGVIVLVALVLVGVMLLTGGVGGHGPGRHSGGGDSQPEESGEQAAPGGGGQGTP